MGNNFDVESISEPIFKLPKRLNTVARILTLRIDIKHDSTSENLQILAKIVNILLFPLKKQCFLAQVYAEFAYKV